MEYDFSSDLKAIRAILGVTQSELASRIGVQQITLSRNETGTTTPSARILEEVYGYAFANNIKLGKLKEMLWRENMKTGHRLLFHGAKNAIEGEISVTRSRTNNDFGQGFYTGESYDQAISFVSGFERSSLYFIDFDPSRLTCKEYKVDQDWMLTIAYYRGTLGAYSEHPLIRKLISQSRACDYIVAPIADNRMFRIIDSFISGEITDEQCKHCLAATNLGSQYIFIREKAVRNLTLLEKTYISASERNHYLHLRADDARLGDDKVKLAKIQYRGKGHYIDEILK